MASSTQKTGKIRIPCAYCQGKGRDRFGVMSPLSQCAACHGKGFQWIVPPVVRCAYCHGGGVSPTGTRSYCLACCGKGLQSRIDRTASCPDCHSTGSNPNTGMYCNRCHGAGVIRPVVDVPLPQRSQTIEAGDST
ncbi:MAG TPA: hypothetical protein IGS53_01060 [Leptolyngbyaceae cyanobacterium M33_DOE_097]|uniref:CR-type domain-containing protein n=1 Tax=Oscillatoriales cyanobacterium SpSt-418 TaxID=2282169 RepID=A0A7C3PD21_9CYAN|nr:hypothetical protein [Leptolyngbyaceae cyanobacterium M33_DOE_097]